MLLGWIQLSAQNSPGDLNTGFGLSGAAFYYLNLNGSSQIQDLLHLPSGETFAIGTISGGGNANSFVAKIDATGNLVNSFGNNGVVTIDVGIGANDGARAAAVDPNGHIVITGVINTGNSQDAYVLRISRDGLLDTTFSSNGIATYDWSGADEYPNAIIAQPDGKILVAGHENSNGSNLDVFVVRIHVDGIMDYSFDTDGKKIMDLTIGAPESFDDIQLMSDGRIVAVGYMGMPNDRDMAVIRLMPNGDYDLTFSQDGIARIDIDGNQDAALCAHVYDDGKILLGGLEINSGEYNPAMVKLAANGNISLSFSQDGKLVANYIIAAHEAFFDMAIQENGKIVCAGFIYDGSEKHNILIARFAEDGALVNDFGSNGYVSIDASNRDADDVGMALAITADGDILVAGMTGDSASLVSVKGDDVSTGIFSPNASNIELLVQPNPFANEVSFSCPTVVGETFVYRVTDLSGRQVIAGEIIAGSSETRVELGASFAHLPPGGYLLQIAHGQDAIGTMLLKQ
jgi:uncharacterized delta-60 repeat protein